MSNVKNSQFQLVTEQGWRRGMGNLLRGELSSWFGSTRWLRQVILWLVVINLILFFTTIGLADATQQAIAAGDPQPDVDTPMLYGVFGGMFVAFGVMIMMQRAVVGEKRDGTAAWVLSKPVTRTAFIASRLIGNSVGVLVTAVVVPGIVAYVTMGLNTPLGWLPLHHYLAGMAVVALSAIFWLTFTLMMGTFFEKSAGVIAVPMALYVAMWMLPSVFPPLMYITPVILTIGPDDVGTYQGISTALMLGQTPFSWLPVISAVLFSVIFVTVAIRRFNRTEF